MEMNQTKCYECGRAIDHAGPNHSAITCAACIHDFYAEDTDEDEDDMTTQQKQYGRGINEWCYNRYHVSWKQLQDKLQEAADTIGLRLEHYQATSIQDSETLEYAVRGPQLTPCSTTARN